MEAQLPVIGIILASLSAMIVGMVWYSSKVTGTAWMAMIGIKDKDMQAKIASAMPMLVAAALVTAYTLALFTNYAHAFNGGTWMTDSIMTAIWLWIGFGVTTIVAHGVFEPRDRRVMLINAGNRLVTLLVMAVILGLFYK